MFGENPSDASTTIRVDQGLDTTEISPSRRIDDNLIETQFIVEIDNRFGDIVSENGTTTARPSFIDDDNVASYFFSLGTDTDFVTENTVTGGSTGQTIAGPRGTFIKFRIRASLELNSSNFLFTKLGTSGTITDNVLATINIDYIDTNIKVTGATTGYAIDVPVRFIRNQ